MARYLYNKHSNAAICMVYDLYSSALYLMASDGRLRKELNLTTMRVQQVHGVSFKKRAPRAIKEIRSFAEKAMVCARHPSIF